MRRIAKEAASTPTEAVLPPGRSSTVVRSRSIMVLEAMEAQNGDEFAVSSEGMSYAPECVEGRFSELRLEGVLGRWAR